MVPFGRGLNGRCKVVLIGLAELFLKREAWSTGALRILTQPLPVSENIGGIRSKAGC